jgi:hypothetical protein
MVLEWNVSTEQWWDKLQGKMEVFGDKIIPSAFSWSTNLTWNLTGRKASLCCERFRAWSISQSVFNAMYYQTIRIIPANHGSLNFLCLRDTSIILGWFGSRKCKNNSKWCTLLPKLLKKIIVYAHFISVDADRIIQPGGQRVGGRNCEC